MLKKLLLRLRDERGISLVVALGITTVLSISVGSMVVYTTASQREASRSNADQLALALAEAGLNNAMAVLANPDNNALHQDILANCTPIAPATTVPAPLTQTYDSGTSTVCGDLDRQQNLWKITAIGNVRNPTGPSSSPVMRTVTARIPVTPSVAQPLNNPAWNYMFATRTGNTCDMTLDNSVDMGASLYVNGNLCLDNGSTISGGPLVVKGNMTLLKNNNSVGTSANPVEVHLGGWCKYFNNAQHTPCTSADNVWGPSTSTIPAVSGINADWDHYYANAIPGPGAQNGCTTVSGTPPVFDNDGVRNNSIATVFNLTPASADYTCRVGPADNPAGELSWNHTTKVLTLRGTMYIDGSVIADLGSTLNYNGQATLYLSGTFKMQNGTKFCGGTANGTCDFNAWNPNTEMFVIVANGSGGQVPDGDSIQLSQAFFQGALYATNACELSNSTQTEGPVECSTIVIQQSVTAKGFPTISTVPDGMPGNPQVYAQPNQPTLFSG
jgi:Tfp pilus assembly protein PilX